MKKIGVLFLIALLLFSFLVSAETLGAVKDTLDANVDKAENARDTLGEKWDYLGKEWQNIFLNNSIVSGVDTSLKKVNFIFVFLFGEDYSLSLIFLLVIVFWAFFLRFFYVVFRDFSMFDSGISLAISFASVVICAQVKIFHLISLAVLRVFFYDGAGFVLLRFLIFLLMTLLGFWWVNKFSKSLKLGKEARAKQQEKLNREILNAETKKFKIAGKGFKK